MLKEDRLAVARYLRRRVDMLNKMRHKEAIQKQIDRLMDTVRRLEKE